MSLIVACPYCQTRYNLPKSFEGKKVKCKSCGKPFSASVAAARVQNVPAQKASAQKKQDINPQELAKMGIDSIKSSADPFAAPPHHGPDPLRNHVVQDPGFQMPTEPSSASNSPTNFVDESEVSDVVANPYIDSLPKPTTDRKPAKKGQRVKIVTTKVGAGDIISYAADIWRNNLGLVVGATLVVFVTGIALAGLQILIQGLLVGQDMAQASAIFGFVFGAFANGFQIFLTIGQTIINLKLLRGQRAGFGDLFGGSEQLVPVAIASLLFGIGLTIGMMLVVIPGIVFALYFWPFYSLIVDKKAKIFDSFGKAASIASANLGTSFLLGLVTFGIMIMGTLVLLIGIIFAAPLVGLIWTAGYLMMSGQIRAKE